MWEFTIEPSGAQRFTWDEPVFGTMGFVGHWLLEHSRLRIPDLEAANPLARWFGVNAKEPDLQRFLNELEIRHPGRIGLPSRFGWGEFSLAVSDWVGPANSLVEGSC